MVRILTIVSVYHVVVRKQNINSEGFVRDVKLSQ